MMETKCKSSASATNALSPWAISPAPKLSKYFEQENTIMDSSVLQKINIIVWHKINDWGKLLWWGEFIQRRHLKASLLTQGCSNMTVN